MLDKHIARKIDSGDQRELIINPPTSKTIQVVDFYGNVVRQVFTQNTHTIMLSHKIDHTHRVVCLFLNNKSKQVIDSKKYVYLSSFNKDLNAAFKSSVEETEDIGNFKLCICYGKHVYMCKNISGTIYIVWALYINRTNAGKITKTLYNDTPVLLNFDGQARTKAAYILKPEVLDETDLFRLPITENDPVLLFEKDDPIFVCEEETIFAAALVPPIKTVTYSDAISIVSMLSNDDAIIKQIPNRFSASIDTEVEVDETNPLPDQGTPRAVLYLRDIDIRNDNNTTPPVIPSDAEDPFSEK